MTVLMGPPWTRKNSVQVVRLMSNSSPRSSALSEEDHMSLLSRVCQSAAKLFGLLSPKNVNSTLDWD
ncbi:hypothetical protein OJAV_G00090460 [Oryzias javanicus]|uniref:Uncharacterized protein n=1 Tax=Oryzias javanicus TaxID=123683 RepID=A0A437D033_ORYJA|nr:hypothetical protein OJAV_G00090460 [Oryzias javanicus]